MSNIRTLLLCLSLSACCVAMAPPRYRIANIVNKNSLTDDENKRITQYAQGWAEALDTSDTSELHSARQRLISPLEPSAEMSPYVRSVYCAGVIDGIEPLLDPKNTNEMGLVNALQVLSVIGNEQTSRLLLNSADSTKEMRGSARLWASIGLGKSFTVGVLPLRKVERDANRLANYISIEPEWFVIAKQLSSLTNLQKIPNLNTNEQEKFDEMSLELQSSAIDSLVKKIGKSGSADERMLAISIALPSIRIQLIDPNIYVLARDSAQKALLQTLSDLVLVSIRHAATAKENDMLFSAYGQAINTAGLMVDRELDLADDSRVSLLELWNNENTVAISDRVAQWNKLSKK